MACGTTGWSHRLHLYWHHQSCLLNPQPKRRTIASSEQEAAMAFVSTREFAPATSCRSRRRSPQIPCASSCTSPRPSRCPLSHGISRPAGFTLCRCQTATEALSVTSFIVMFAISAPIRIAVAAFGTRLTRAEVGQKKSGDPRMTRAISKRSRTTRGW